MDTKRLIAEYDRFGWVAISKGNWSFLSITDFVQSYTFKLDIEGKNPFDHPVQVCIGNRSELWVPQDELDAFGQRIKSVGTPDGMKSLMENVERTGEVALSFIRTNTGSGMMFDADRYELLWSRIRDYYQYHLIVKYIGEYLSPEDLSFYSTILGNARTRYGEPIFDESEKLTRAILDSIGERTGMDSTLLAYMTRDELDAYFRNNSLPPVSDLKKRRKKTIVLGTPTGYVCLTGTDADLIESYLYRTKSESADRIIGVSAYRGQVTGTTRIVLDPSSAGEFKEGDILVTGMTHVDYLPLIKKSSAIVTDAGGVLSHAAIIARELRKPCVIGTNNATRILHGGDLIEVDADNGEIRILSKAEDA